MRLTVHQIARRASGLCAPLDSALNTVSSTLNSSRQQLPVRFPCGEKNPLLVDAPNHLG